MEEEKTPIEAVITNLEGKIKELSDYLKPLKRIKEHPKILVNELKKQLNNSIFLNYTEAEVEFDIDFDEEFPGEIILIINISIPFWKQSEINRKLPKRFKVTDLGVSQFVIKVDNCEFVFDVTEIYKNKLLITGY